MNNYQLTVLVKNELDEKSRRVLLDEVVKQFGKLSKEDLWGARSLTYPIAHQDRAFYAHFEFEAEPQTISALDKNLKLNEDIIRFLLTKKEFKRIRIKRGKIKPQVVGKSDQPEAELAETEEKPKEE